MDLEALAAMAMQGILACGTAYHTRRPDLAAARAVRAALALRKELDASAGRFEAVKVDDPTGALGSLEIVPEAAPAAVVCHMSCPHCKIHLQPVHNKPGRLFCPACLYECPAAEVAGSAPEAERDVIASLKGVADKAKADAGSNYTVVPGTVSNALRAAEERGRRGALEHYAKSVEGVALDHSPTFAAIRRFCELRAFMETSGIETPNFALLGRVTLRDFTAGQFRAVASFLESFLADAIQPAEPAPEPRPDAYGSIGQL